MDEFKKQLENNLQSDFSEFNNNAKYSNVRKLYKENFEEIKLLILKFGNKMALEDIGNLNLDLRSEISSNILLLKEINKGISNGKITLENIK